MQKKLKIENCEYIIEKMVAVIKTWSIRNLSFAGRLHLIEFRVATFVGGQIFIFPKVVLKKLMMCACLFFYGQGLRFMAVPKHIV